MLDVVRTLQRLWPASLAIALVACAPSADPPRAQTPEVDCDPAQIEPAPRLSCDNAVLAALAVTGTAGVRRVSFRYGTPCPPNARCVAPTGDEGYVVIALIDGRCGVVTTALEGGTVRTSALGSWPPPAWGQDVDALALCR